MQPNALLYPQPTSLLFAFGEKRKFVNTFFISPFSTISCLFGKGSKMRCLDTFGPRMKLLSQDETLHHPVERLAGKLELYAPSRARAPVSVRRAVDAHLHAFRTRAAACMCACMHMHVSGGPISFAVDCVVEWRGAHLRRFEERSGNSSDSVLL